MWLFHDPCAGTNIWNAYDEDIEMKIWSSLCTKSSVNAPEFSGVTNSLMTAYKMSPI